MNKWDERFSGREFFYGQRPNLFFAEFLSNATEKGHLLLPAEGEGRNAVYAAKTGWQVDAFDSSAVAKDKALAFAKQENVHIDYELLDIASFVSRREKYDLIALIFVHLPEGMRRRFHRQIFDSIRPGGKLVVEAFAKEQIHNRSGGPPDVQLLYSLDILKEDFAGMKTIRLCRQHEFLDEGRHRGPADLVRLIAVKEG